ncbi:hypothetical protein NF699_11030 [Sphingomonadaceae bacterium OTU29LAMAA1]|nr:hypothetical protein NF699_11030 [Sphingomonadaceae bacterium OTU29LAMAA1]
MSDTDQSRTGDRDERAARLAAQLRANLHRRKAQARAAARPTDTSHPSGTPDD